MSEKIDFDFDKLLKNWPSLLVPRNKLSEFSGGILNPKTVKTLDSSGRGIPGRFRCGRLIVYPSKNVVKFLKDRSSAVINHEVHNVK
ncbi:MAG: hypothetical protein KKC46_13625 [Proteobacteria bacterium]|nr:hypothetical protein [Pseudomonadota bacterium]